MTFALPRYHLSSAAATKSRKLVELMTELLLLGDPTVASVPVLDSGENLVDLRCVEGLAVDQKQGAVNPSFALLRRGVVHRLLEAQVYLPSTCRLLVVEGLRPPDLQERYFTDYQRKLERITPTLDARGRRRLASRHVSPPDVAPHVTGAAVDLSLTDGCGRLLDMGTEVHAPPGAVAGASYFAADGISDEAKYHRQLLATALLRAEFVNYPTQWWHWSFGDRYWARTQGRPAAMYGPVDVGKVAPTPSHPFTDP